MAALLFQSFTCPTCHYVFDHPACLTVDDRETLPREGDLLICTRCDAVSRFRSAGIEAIDETAIAGLAREIQLDIHQSRLMELDLSARPD